MESKSIFLSITFWSVIVTLCSEVAKRYGLTVDQAGLTNDLVSLAGIAMTIYGRVRATQPVHILPPAAGGQ